MTASIPVGYETLSAGNLPSLPRPARGIDVRNVVGDAPKYRHRRRPMGWVMDVIWFSVFLAWTAKMVVLKSGDPGLYARSRPLFLGPALGQIVAGGLWLLVLVDYLTGTVGNRIHMLY